MKITERMKQPLSKTKPLVLPLLIAMGGLLTYFLLVGQPIWGENDDVAMSRISAGVWNSPGPSPDLLFIHPIYGAVISHLYKWQPGLPWYALAFLMIICIALGSMNYAMLRLPKFPQNIYGYLLLIFANLATVLPALWHLQFTVVAGLASLSGCILLLSLYIYQPSKQPTWIFGIVTGIFLLLIGAMVRIDSMVMVLILVAPTGLILLLKEIIAQKTIKSRKSYIANLIIVLFILGASNFSLYLISETHYSVPQLKTWKELTQAMYQVVTSPIIKYNQATADIFASAGLTKNDYHMLKSWQYIDPAHHQSKNINQVVNSIYSRKQELNSSANNIDIIRFLSVLANHAKPTASILTGALLIAMLIIINNRLGLLCLLSLLSTATLLYSYIYFVLNRPIFRVILILFLGILWMLLLIFSSENKSSDIKLPRWLRYALLTTVICLNLITLRFNVQDAKAVVNSTVSGQSQLEKIIQSWQSHLPDKAIIYNIGPCFPSEYHLPLKSFDYLATIKGFISSDWGNQSPLQRGVIESLNLNPDEFYLSLSNQPDVYTVVPVRRDYEQFFVFAINTLSQFYREKYNISLYLTPEPNLPNLYRMNFLHPSKGE